MLRHTPLLCCCIDYPSIQKITKNQDFSRHHVIRYTTNQRHRLWSRPGLGLCLCLWHDSDNLCVTRSNAAVLPGEMCSPGGRPGKSGLVASAVVSSWTWAATLLQSSGVAYRYGVSGPFWYASGATVQILLFATLAIELKRRAPNAHTFLEVIRARYGVYAHLVFTVFGLMTNVLVTTMVIMPAHVHAPILTFAFSCLQAGAPLLHR